MPEFVSITTSADQRTTLERIARELVARRLAACVQIAGPVESHYRWQGKSECTQEWTCQIKTTTDRQDAVMNCIGESHRYELPEIIVTPIVGGSRTYLAWLADQVADEQNPDSS